ATVIYLLSILQGSSIVPVLIVLLLTAVLCAAWGHWIAFRRTRRFRMAIAVLFFAITAAFSVFVLKQDDSVSFTSFDASEFRNDLGSRTMLVEFTADWCPTCKVLEKTVLTKDFIDQLVKKYSLLFIKADMTTADPDLESLLKSLGIYSIPALALFPEGKENSRPVILRDLYTQTQVTEMLKSALD
ncbi:MAG: thioredoxin family protein, partial [Mailhella sp.]|nr:thioredoxin family protein [Mailhella sp.]